jgi:hypothetical protein
MWGTADLRNMILESLARRTSGPEVPLGTPALAERPQIYPGLPSGVAAPAPYSWTPGQRPYVDVSRFSGVPMASAMRRAYTPMTNGFAAYQMGQERAAERTARQMEGPPGAPDLYGGLHGRERALAYPDKPWSQGGAGAPSSNLLYFQRAQAPVLRPPTAGMKPFQYTTATTRK